MLMFDLHCHSLFSDGELVLSELVRRLEVKGYDAVCVTDHADESNIDFIMNGITKAYQDINRYSETKLIPGIELTHVYPNRLRSLTEKARALGAKIVVCHGETIVEPVVPGTNKAAIEAGVDILAHPGIISREDVLLAKKKGVLLEISGRKGHSLTNGHVAALATEIGARLVINSDGHAPGDFMEPSHARNVGIGAGLSIEAVEDIYEVNWRWLQKILKG